MKTETKVILGGAAVLALLSLSRRAATTSTLPTTWDYTINNRLSTKTLLDINGNVIYTNPDSANVINKCYSLLTGGENVKFTGDIHLANTMRLDNATDIYLYHDHTQNEFFHSDHGDYYNIVSTDCSNVTYNNFNITNSGYAGVIGGMQTKWDWTFCHFNSQGLNIKNCYITNSQESDYRTSNCDNVTFDNCFSNKVNDPNNPGDIVGDCFDIYYSRNVHVNNCTWINNLLRFYASDSCDANNCRGALFGAIEWVLDHGGDPGFCIPTCGTPNAVRLGCTNITFNGCTSTGSNYAGFSTITAGQPAGWPTIVGRHKNIKFNNCTATNNSDYGFLIYDLDTGYLNNCHGSNNTPGNYYISSDSTNVIVNPQF